SMICNFATQIYLTFPFIAFQCWETLSAFYSSATLAQLEQSWDDIDKKCNADNNISINFSGSENNNNNCNNNNNNNESIQNAVENIYNIIRRNTVTGSLLEIGRRQSVEVGANQL